jgi:hypothetical protein
MPVKTLDLDWEDFLQMAEYGEPKWESRSSARTSKNSWSGTRTFQDSIDLARNGWQEGRDLMQSGLDMAKDVNRESFAPSQWYDVAGEYCDVPRYCGGDPECMVNRGEAMTSKTPVLRLLVAVGGNCGTSKAQFNNYGGAILSWLDSLEESGFRVELSFALQTNGRNDKEARSRFGAIVKIKEAGDPLEIDRIAFAFCHPSLFRRLWFRIMECHKEFESSHCGSYGYQQATLESDREGYVYIDGISNDAETMRARLHNVESAVEAIGEIIKEAIEG